MIKHEMMQVVSQRPLTHNVYELTLQGELVRFMNEPGQFVHIRVNNDYLPLLRRPISIAEIDQTHEQFTMIYRAEGAGTSLLAEKQAGQSIDVLGPLGHGFPLEAIESGQTALLVGEALECLRSMSFQKDFVKRRAGYSRLRLSIKSRRILRARVFSFRRNIYCNGRRLLRNKRFCHNGD